VRYLRDRQIPLEICISSNVATGAIPSLRDHPVRKLYDAGVPIVLNTDDPAMFDTDHGRDYEAAEADLQAVEAGAPCARCGRPLRVTRAMELGHLFQLGMRYTAPYSARYLDAEGQERDLVACSYGIGLDRAIAAIAECHHDERGLRWPRAVAPFEVHVCALNLDRAGVRPAADRLVRALEGGGLTVLYDDRDDSAGVKFADADLLGLPVRVTVSARTLLRGEAELKPRLATEAESVGLDHVPARAEALLS